MLIDRNQTKFTSFHAKSLRIQLALSTINMASNIPTFENQPGNPAKKQRRDEEEEVNVEDILPKPSGQQLMDISYPASSSTCPLPAFTSAKGEDDWGDWGAPAPTDTPASPDVTFKHWWETATHDYEKTLARKMAELATRLHTEIADGRWRKAIHTFKLILDLSPRQRHPPLFGWREKDWHHKLGCPHCDDDE